MRSLFRFVACVVLLPLAGLHAQSPARPAGPPEPRVEPVEVLTVEPGAVVGWATLVGFDLELARAGVQPRYSASPDPFPEVVHEIPGTAPSAPRRAPGGAAGAAKGACAGHASEPALTGSFSALPEAGTVIPPDTNGAVGPAHVMTMLNDRVRIHNRVGALVSTVSLIAFWSSVAGTDVFDPKLLYDAAAGRWYATACANRRSASSSVVFAASASSDPTGTWSFYAFDGDASNQQWVDFPGLGFNSQWVAVTENMYEVSNDSFEGVKMWVLDRATVLAGGALTVSVFPTGFDQLPSGARGNTIVPCTTHDPAEGTLYLVNNNFSSGGIPLLRLTRLTGTGPAPSWSPVPGSSLAGPGTFLVDLDFERAQNDAPQLGDVRLIDTNDTRVLGAVVRNGAVWLTHSGRSGDVTGVLWYEVDPTALPDPIVQSGWIWDPVEHHFFPSIAVNCAGDVCLGFSRSSPARYAEAAYAVRLATDPSGTFGPVRQLKAGEDAYFKDFGSGRNRWGDYSVTTVDPLDDQTFWTIQEFAFSQNGAGLSRWSTWWGRIGECGEPTLTDPPDPATVCPGQPIVLSVGATAFLPPLTYRWRKDGNDLMGETGSVLSIAAASAMDAGLYEVRVRDGCGEVTSAPVAVTVLPGATITAQPASQDACEGDAVELDVGASGTGLTYRWRKDGVVLPDEVSCSLVFPAVAAGDAGTYDVIVTAASGCETASAPAQLRVHSVVLTQQPAGATRCVGQAVTFAVGATGTQLVYRWRKDGVDLPGETQSTLVLTRLTTDDAGSYDVVVSSDGFCSVTSTAAELVVETCKFLPRKL